MRSATVEPLYRATKPLWFRVITYAYSYVCSYYFILRLVLKKQKTVLRRRLTQNERSTRGGGCGGAGSGYRGFSQRHGVDHVVSISLFVLFQKDRRLVDQLVTPSLTKLFRSAVQPDSGQVHEQRIADL